MQTPNHLRHFLLAPAIVCGIAAGWAGHAAAATAKGDFSVRGFGAESCSDLSATLSGKSGRAVAIEFANWTAGYLTRVNRDTANTFEVTPLADNEPVAQIAANLCRANPKALVESVLAGMVARFRPVSQDAASKLLDVVDGRYRVSIRQAVLRRIQEVLIRANQLPADSADGSWGPKTQGAIAKFQQSRKLKVTGVPDPATVIDLLVASRPSK